jgi:signal transduction histidine kinase/CheY-like chemotaxis protein
MSAATECYSTGKSGLLEFRWITKDGKTVWVESRSAVVTNEEGLPAGLRGITIDITNRKNLEEQLRQAQKMEAIGQLAGGIAHDFNNLLTVIVGYSGLAMEQFRPEDPLRHDLEEINKAGQRASSMTRQLLAFSRKQVLRLRVCDLNGIVSEMDKMLQRLIGENIRLETSLCPELGSVKADPSQLEQVIMNLAVNARDAMPYGGRLTITTANHELDESYLASHIAVSPGPYVMLAITDTGCGMDRQTQAHIFEPFFTTKAAGYGTGLGLSTVYGIITQLGGNIWVYSEVDEGTTFRIYLPRVDERGEDTETRICAVETLRGSETVLLVEDDMAVRRFAREVLEREGYRVLESANARDAFSCCERYDGNIDLLVTDVVMPGLSGRDLAEGLAAMRPGLRVLYMSGYAGESNIFQTMVDQAARLIQKPFSARMLCQKVREVLEQPPLP